MEDDSLDVNDDHNHNYRASGSSSRVHTYLSSQLSDGRTVPLIVWPPVRRAEPGIHRGTPQPRVCTGEPKLVDSDSDSESEVSESECPAPTAAVKGKFTLDSTSKFRKLIYNGESRTECWYSLHCFVLFFFEIITRNQILKQRTLNTNLKLQCVSLSNNKRCVQTSLLLHLLYQMYWQYQTKPEKHLGSWDGFDL